MTAKNDLVLDISDLVVHYETMEGTVKALNGVNMKIEHGRTLGLVGETGAGKTTTALSIMRLIPDPPGIIKSGKIMFEGNDILKLPESKIRELRGSKISMIFQDPMTSLNPVITVGEQIAEVYRVHETISIKQAEEKANEMLELVGIPSQRSCEYPHQFSGGMRQRVMIAIALACNPKLLIADEPTTALDVTIQSQVLDLMKELIKKLDMSMIMITHDLGIVAEVCDEVMVMYAGRIIEQGSVRNVFKNTLHPYTEGLFNSLPSIHNEKERLKPIPGLMPDPLELPLGCAFAPRCSYADERCNKGIPEIRNYDTHSVACYAYDRPGFKLRGRN